MRFNLGNFSSHRVKMRSALTHFRSLWGCVKPSEHASLRAASAAIALSGLTRFHRTVPATPTEHYQHPSSLQLLSDQLGDPRVTPALSGTPGHLSPPTPVTCAARRSAPWRRCRRLGRPVAVVGADAARPTRCDTRFTSLRASSRSLARRFECTLRTGIVRSPSEVLWRSRCSVTLRDVLRQCVMLRSVLWLFCGVLWRCVIVCDVPCLSVMFCDIL